MAGRGKRFEKVVYEEKPVCGRCGNTIVGVVPRTKDGKPLCRDCIYELDEMSRKPGGRIVVEKEKPPLTPEEKRKRVVIGTIMVILLGVLSLRLISIAPLLQPERPLRRGTYDTDPMADRCINELWKISRLLQEDRLPADLPPCPASAKPYVVTRGEEDTVVSCPSPASHRLLSLSVSYKKPVPVVIGETGG